MQFTRLQTIRRAVYSFFIQMRICVHRLVYRELVLDCNGNDGIAAASQHFVYASVDLPEKMGQILVLVFAFRTRTEQDAFRRAGARTGGGTIVADMIRLGGVHVCVVTGCDARRKCDLLRASCSQAKQAYVLLAQAKCIEDVFASKLRQQRPDIEISTGNSFRTHWLLDPAHTQNVR